MADVGLTAHDMSDMGRLAQLAANPQDTTREEIFLAVASLYRIQGGYLNPRERELMQDILRRLSRDVEMTIRIALAERLADDSTAPHDLILLLADDAIEVARPLILRSPLLTDADILRLIAENGEPHHETVARRSHIGEPICDALVHSNSEPVLTALVRNVTAKLSESAFRTLIEKSRHIAKLRDPLVRRTDLPSDLALKMADWVSDALKSYIVQNFHVGAEPLNRAFAHAAQVLANEPAEPRLEPDEGARKLIDKLATAGQLKAGFLLRVLQQGQIDLFDMGFARLLSLPLMDMRHKFYETGPKAVALSCRAAGIDRSVFTTVFNLSRQARNMRPALSNQEQTEVEVVFNHFTRAAALAELQAA